MVASIVISANFSDAACPILAGANEDSLEATSLRVSDAARPLSAVKLLAGDHDTALVISRHYDNQKGWLSTRKNFKRVKPKQ